MKKAVQVSHWPAGSSSSVRFRLRQDDGQTRSASLSGEADGWQMTGSAVTALVMGDRSPPRGSVSRANRGALVADDFAATVAAAVD